MARTASKKTEEAPEETSADASESPQSEAPANAGDAGFDGNSGPGTGVEAEPESTPRMPTQQPVHAESGPLNPSDAKTQITPEFGYADSSTDDTYAATGGRTIAGEDHVGLEDEDGNELGEDDLFEDEGEAQVTVKKTVIQKFTYSNAPDHPETRLLMNKGQKVTRRQADAVKASLGRKQEPTFAAQTGDSGESPREK